MRTEELTPVLRIGSLDLPFPEGMASPAAVRDLYAANYPHIDGADIGEPFEDGGLLVYAVARAATATKGAAFTPAQRSWLSAPRARRGRKPIYLAEPREDLRQIGALALGSVLDAKRLPPR